MTDSHKSLWAVAPLFLILFIDSMGLGLLFPILNSIIIDTHVNFLPAATGPQMRSFLYGVIISIFMISWFFGAAILGDMSDVAGRKKALLVCLLGAAFGYLVSGIGIVFHSVSLLIIGRVIAGFTAGSQPIAQAAIVDVSTEEHKARNIGFILLAVSLGFVFGPVCGGVLSDRELVGWFTFATPLYFASLLSFLNAVLLWFIFSETFDVKGRVKISLTRAVQIFISAFRHHKVRALSVVFLIMMFGWSNYFSFISVYLFNTYHYKPLYVALFLAVMGVGFSIGCGYLVDYFTHRYSLKNVYLYSFALATLFVLLTLLFRQWQWVTWLGGLGMGVTVAVGYSTVLTMFSNQVTAEEQGWVMGITGSIMALVFGLTTFFTGLVANFSSVIPMALAIFGLGLSVVAMYLVPFG